PAWETVYEAFGYPCARRYTRPDSPEHSERLAYSCSSYQEHVRDVHWRLVRGLTSSRPCPCPLRLCWWNLHRHPPFRLILHRKCQLLVRSQKSAHWSPTTATSRTGLTIAYRRWSHMDCRPYRSHPARRQDRLDPSGLRDRWSQMRKDWS